MSTINARVGPGFGTGSTVGTLEVGGSALASIWVPDLWLDPVGDFGVGTIGVGEDWINDFGDQFDLTSDRRFSGDYRLEVRDPDGVLLGKLPDFYGSKWVDEVNSPGSLSFSYPGTDALASDLVFPNLVYLYRGTEFYPERVFIIQSATDDEGTGYAVRVEAEGVLSQLGREQIVSTYNSPGSSKTVRTILSEILGTYQNLSNQFNLGFIDSSIGDSSIPYRVEKKSILEVLRELQGLFGGYYYPTAERRIVWRNEVGSHEGHVIKFGRNATKISRSRDWRSIETRLVATADTYAGGSVSVTVDDLDAQALYGIRTGYYKSIPVSGSSQLSTLATAELARRSAPRSTVSVGAIDLSQIDRYDYSFEALALDPGSTIRILSEDSGIDLDLIVWRVTRDLGKPLAVSIDPVDPTSTLAEGNERGRRDFLDAVLKVLDYVSRTERGI